MINNYLLESHQNGGYHGLWLDKVLWLSKDIHPLCVVIVAVDGVMGIEGGDPGQQTLKDKVPPVTSAPALPSNHL